MKINLTLEENYLNILLSVMDAFVYKSCIVLNVMCYVFFLVLCTKQTSPQKDV